MVVGRGKRLLLPTVDTLHPEARSNLKRLTRNAGMTADEATAADDELSQASKAVLYGSGCVLRLLHSSL
jgi:hypothetical protein